MARISKKTVTQENNKGNLTPIKNVSTSTKRNYRQEKQNSKLVPIESKSDYEKRMLEKKRKTLMPLKEKYPTKLGGVNKSSTAKAAKSKTRKY